MALNDFHDGLLTAKELAALRWVFERSSGYAGWRCAQCFAWVREGDAKECSCDAVLSGVYDNA